MDGKKSVKASFKKKASVSIGPGIVPDAPACSIPVADESAGKTSKMLFITQY